MSDGKMHLLIMWLQEISLWNCRKLFLRMTISLSKYSVLTRLAYSERPGTVVPQLSSPLKDYALETRLRSKNFYETFFLAIVYVLFYCLNFTTVQALY